MSVGVYPWLILLNSSFGSTSRHWFLAWKHEILSRLAAPAHEAVDTQRQDAEGGDLVASQRTQDAGLISNELTQRGNPKVGKIIKSRIVKRR